jgi:4-hydroxyacetophenone monooxygenase
MAIDASNTSAIRSEAARSSQNDEAFIRGALLQADPNALRLTLYQLTGDEALTSMAVERMDLWGGALFTYALAAQHHEEVRQKAFEFLQRHPQATEASFEKLSVPRARKIMELFGQGPLTDDEFRCSYEEAAFAEFPRGVEWTKKPPAGLLANTHVLVIGAGISGIASAVQLHRLGIPFSVIERQDDLGGTWNLNKYPEARVDSSSFIYQYKFEKKYPWKEFFASGGETKAYLKHCATKFGVFDRIVFKTEVLKAVWNEATSKWDVTLRHGDAVESTLSVNFMVNATGLFATPKLPDIEGIDTFKGRAFHTTGWDHQFDLAGKRVALIGNGSTGAQLMPHLAREAASLTIFQRTPNWVVPLDGYKAAVSAEMQWLFDRFPFYWNWFSYGLYFLNTQLEGLQSLDLEWQKNGGTVNKRNDGMRATVEQLIKDKFAGRPDLISKVLPSFPPLARRLVVDNGWLDALKQDNVELVTEGIDRITERGIKTKTGREFEFDLIVYAAGFAVTKYFWPIDYVGRNGATLDKLWAADGPRAHIGMTIPGFPNLFICYGPNAQGRSGSFYSMAEVWSRYAMQAIVRVIEGGGKSIECRREAYVEYNKKLDAQAKTLLWETFGRGHYYLTAQGRSVVNSPWTVVDYQSLLAQPDLKDFDVH